MISRKAIDLIKSFENDPEDYLGHPEWPGEESGITIGFGWDLGHTPWDQTDAAWHRHFTETDLKLLASVNGKKGQAAREVLPRVVRISVPYSAAEQVFEEITVPAWTVRTLRIYPQAGDLHGDCLGALVSLVFNRGAALGGPRRSEMLEIQNALKDGTVGRIPELLASMKRLWPDSAGLRRRRDAEAKLFQDGLLAGGE